eukprot:TRINITY_DN40866_c0_g2_i2.p1 TRINITY_DN40866_c0_g2~~TRINITY_DN40866_c0_g2_i2.p1  ORF type:complete len:234 (+),score=49.74 TRINITY_DN40866_c0_g2_i2:53-703(+)
MSGNLRLIQSARSRKWQASIEVLAGLQRQRLQPSSAARIAVVRSCGYAWQWSLSLLQADDYELEADKAAAINAVMTNSEKSSQWERALALWSMLAEDVATPISQNAALWAMQRGGQWQAALALLLVGSRYATFWPECVAVATVLRACEVAGQWAAMVVIMRSAERQVVATLLGEDLGSMLHEDAGVAGVGAAIALRLWRYRQPPFFEAVAPAALYS